MNKSFLNIFFFFYFTHVSGQYNLVPNSGFEDIDSCYGNFSGLSFDVFQWSGCTGWRNPSMSSPDLWCNNPIAGSGEPPYIGGAYQFPRSGNNMAGLFAYEGNGFPNYREYIQCELTGTLEAEKFYDISFFVNQSDTFIYTSCIGAYFSILEISQMSSWNVLNFNPQIKNPSDNFITDTLSWTEIKGTFKANGGEKFMTIGCFDDSSKVRLTDSMNAGSVYFFVDDLTVIESEMDLFIPNIFTPNNDMENDFFAPIIVNILDWKLSIYNRWGQFIRTLDKINPVWDGEMDNELVSPGVYYYVFESKEKEIQKKGFIQLLR